MRKLICIFPAALLLASLLTSCATTTDYAKQAYDYGKQATSWVGQKVESLYAKEGPPSAVQPQADGGNIIEYQKTRTIDAAPATPAAAANTQPPNTRVVPCTTRYRTDSTGTIRSWTIDGTGCKAVEEVPSENK